MSVSSNGAARAQTQPKWPTPSALLDGGMLIVLFAILPLEHTPGLRYLLCVMLGLRGVALLIADPDGSFLKRAWGLWPWLLWASASYFWSVSPNLTLADLKHDLWAPALALFGAYQILRRHGCFTVLLWASAAGTLANFLVTVFGGPTAAYPLPLAGYYYSTIDYSSTYAMYFCAIALPWAIEKGGRGIRLLAGIVLIVNLGGAVLIGSRAFLVALALLLVVAGLVVATRGRWRGAVAVVMVAVLTVAVFAVINRNRTVQYTENGGVVAGLNHILQHEVRFRIWRSWADRAIDGPAVGVGFGRDVPPTTLTPAERQSLQAIDAFAVMHSHNVFINLVAETGWPGLAFFVLMIGQFTWRLARASGAGSSGSQARDAGLLLIAAMILKNQTDVCMLFSPAALFYTALGSTLAWPSGKQFSS